MVSSELKQKVIQQIQGALALQLAFIGVANNLFSTLATKKKLTSSGLAKASGMDAAYVERWCDSAYAFELLDADGDRFELTELGSAFLPSAEGTLMPFAVNTVLSAHIATRASELAHTGERPGESVLAERAPILPWFGPMLEGMFAPMFEQQVLPGLSVFNEIDKRGGTVVDLGCGNGWYLRALTRRFKNIRTVGLDGFEENINQARSRSKAEGSADRMTFQAGDIFAFSVDEPVDVIVMNRALHHVWNRKEDVFKKFADSLTAGGTVLIWEPAWPADRRQLRNPAYRAMSFQNLGEHVQGNHFLQPDEIQKEFSRVSMKSDVMLFMEGNEAVVSAVKS
ncbi:MAG: trans-aconitate 2-methyltransferase [Acidiferrobacterales bacterium]